jgi:release factor glutamine methyltransferase
MIPTPELAHLSKNDFESVYEPAGPCCRPKLYRCADFPAEDTFLLLDALEADQHSLRLLQPRVSLEIGSVYSQSFIFSLSRSLAQVRIRLRHRLYRPHPRPRRPYVPVSYLSLRPLTVPVYLATDINPHACRCTTATGTHNSVAIQAIHANFASPLHARLKHSVDIVLFNPPYVPTVDDEALDAQTLRGIEGSWAGGRAGMAVTDLFLERVEVPLSLTPRLS